jgi:hypothetical protein
MGVSRDAAKKTPIRLRLSGAALQERNDRMPDTHVMSSVRSRVSPEEWQARLDCAAVYRLMAHFGQTDRIFSSRPRVRFVARAVEQRRVALAKRTSLELHWPAMPRLLDRRDPTWRD